MSSRALVSSASRAAGRECPRAGRERVTGRSDECCPTREHAPCAARLTARPSNRLDEVRR
ncbi:hypothetical protein EMIHUDRAFT_373609, partial [Emiliania huxleyi CCMP1516]